MDFGHKRKSTKYLIKRSMKVKDNPNQTVEDVVNKAPMYNKEDMECLATRWLSIDDKVTLILYLL
jgi:hypothetical protein